MIWFAVSSAPDLSLVAFLSLGH